MQRAVLEYLCRQEYSHLLENRIRLPYFAKVLFLFFLPKLQDVMIVFFGIRISPLGVIDDMFILVVCFVVYCIM